MFDTKGLNSVEEIASTIAHEIKNPLSLVKANVELLEMADLDSVYSKNYLVIKNELNKINEMIMDFLQLTNQNSTDHDIVYVYDIIFNILEKYRITLDSYIDFTINCSDKELSVIGDEKNLEKVFLNIFKNAVEALEGEKGTLEINILKSDDKVLISFCDSGVGVKEYETNRLGESLYTTKPNGNGLGFAICQKIIHEHGGTISIKNNETKGATVTVVL